VVTVLGLHFRRSPSLYQSCFWVLIDDVLVHVLHLLFGFFQHVSHLLSVSLFTPSLGDEQRLCDDGKLGKFGHNLPLANRPTTAVYAGEPSHPFDVY